MDGEVIGRIGHGALLLVGVERGDTEQDADATARKISALRFFSGATPMDKTLAEVDGACLVISQFTLTGSLRKGNRPSFTRAENPDVAESLYLRVADQLTAAGLSVATGKFGAMMEVELINDGPVTFLLFASEGRVL